MGGLKLIEGGDKPRVKDTQGRERIQCPECGNRAFNEVILNPSRGKSLDWDKRTGVRRLQCANSKCKKIVT